MDEPRLGHPALVWRSQQAKQAIPGFPDSLHHFLQTIADYFLCFH